MGSHTKSGAAKGAARSDPDSVDLINIEERRSTMRRPTFKAGEITFGENGVMPCIVRNVSENGCLIKLENAHAIPDLVDIRIDIDTPPRQAEIVWRSTTLAGAMFIKKPS